MEAHIIAALKARLIARPARRFGAGRLYFQAYIA
jgi:hypothetical protein